MSPSRTLNFTKIFFISFFLSLFIFNEGSLTPSNDSQRRGPNDSNGIVHFFRFVLLFLNGTIALLTDSHAFYNGHVSGNYHVFGNVLHAESIESPDLHDPS